MWVLIAVALLVLLAPSASAAAQLPREFFGVQGWGTPDLAEFDALGGARVGVLHESLSWGRVEPVPGARDWSHYDEVFANAAQRGIALLPVLVDSPGFASSNPSRPPRTARGRAAFATFAADAVRRYGAAGTFWAERPEIPYVPPIGWEVWNEPNAVRSGTPATQYGKVLASVAEAIRAVDPAETIALAGLAGKNHAPDYLSRLYRQRGMKRHFDAVSLHPYSASVAAVRTFVRRIRSLMNRARDTATPIWITELGWATGGRKSFLRVSQARQAQLLRQSFRALIGMRRSDLVELVIWFCLRDRADRPDQTRTGPSAYNKTGLFDLRRRPKPSWRSFRSFTLATREPERVRPRSPDSTGEDSGPTSPGPAILPLPGTP